jgi:hypothetical protein
VALFSISKFYFNIFYEHNQINLIFRKFFSIITSTQLIIIQFTIIVFFYHHNYYHYHNSFPFLFDLTLDLCLMNFFYLLFYFSFYLILAQYSVVLHLTLQDFKLNFSLIYISNELKKIESYLKENYFHQGFLDF